MHWAPHLLRISYRGDAFVNANVRVRGSAVSADFLRLASKVCKRQGEWKSCRCLLPSLKCTQPQSTYLQVVGPHSDSSLSFLWLWPNLAPWVRSQPPDAHRRAPLIRSGSRREPWSPCSGRGSTVSNLRFYVEVLKSLLIWPLSGTNLPWFEKWN